MDRPAHPETLFHLEPLNETTRAILYHQDNVPFVSMSSERELALEIGYHVSSRPRGGRVIARIGREADLVLPAKNIAQVHIAFEVHPDSHAILLCVRAEKIKSVRVEPLGFRPDGDFRQLVLVWGNPYEIFIGENARPFHFAVRWSLDMLSTEWAVDTGFQAAQARAVNPRWLKTEDDNDLDIRSWYNTRLQTRIVDGVRNAQIGKKLGAGSYGNVHKSIDLDSGHFIAVKIVKPQGDREKMYLHREIKTLQSIKHPHIIEFFGHKILESEEMDKLSVHIFMPLRTGSLNNLAPLPKEKEPSVLLQLSYQMFSALDYLSSQNLCHRDIKPANILYDVKNGNHTFQLADFGLANHQQLAETVCGTRVFAAPELHPDYGLGKYHQSPKMDIWSLFVTIVSLVEQAKFDEEKLAARPYSEILTYIRSAATGLLSGLQAMARENPEQRASAAQMLVMHFNGEGLTTRRSEVGPIPEAPISAATDTQPEAKVNRAESRPDQPVPIPQPTAEWDHPPAYGGIYHDRNVRAPPVAASKPKHQQAQQSVASSTLEPECQKTAKRPLPPPRAAGPSTRREDGQPLPRRKDATNRVVKSQSRIERQREGRRTNPRHFESQDMEF